jgi:hypothetical protein
VCTIPNGFRDRSISLYSSKIVDKKEILRTFSNTGIYCSSGKFEQFTQYNTFSKISLSTTMHFATRVRIWRVAATTVKCTVVKRRLCMCCNDSEAVINPLPGYD